MRNFKLSVWHRLFFLIVILYSLTTVIITVKRYPTNNYDAYISLSGAVEPYVIKIKNKNYNIQKIRESLAPPNELNFDIVEASQAGYSDQEIKNFLLSKGFSQDQVEKTFIEESKIIEKIKYEVILRSQQSSIIYSALVSTIMPLILLYGFGWFISWIYRGFKQKNAQ